MERVERAFWRGIVYTLEELTSRKQLYNSHTHAGYVDTKERKRQLDTLLSRLSPTLSLNPSPQSLTHTCVVTDGLSVGSLPFPGPSSHSLYVVSDRSGRLVKYESLGLALILSFPPTPLPFASAA